MPAQYGADSAEREITRVINGSWAPMRQWLGSAEGARLAQSGQTGALLRAMPWDEWLHSLGPVVPPMERQIMHALRAEMNRVPQVKASMSFNIIDAISVKYAQEQSGKLIKNLQTTVRTTVRTMIADAMRGQETVDTTARRLRSTVGLHPSWAQAVERRREREYLAAIRAGKSDIQAIELADKRAEKYAAKLTRTRALNIARTEIHTSSNVGRFASWEHAIGNGFAGPSSIKEWEPGPGACPICSGLSGERVRWDAAFSNGLVMPPAHPGCRCSTSLLPEDIDVPHIDWLSPTLAPTVGRMR